jgi:hypothetical protein
LLEHNKQIISILPDGAKCRPVPNFKLWQGLQICDSWGENMPAGGRLLTSTKRDAMPNNHTTSFTLRRTRYHILSMCGKVLKHSSEPTKEIDINQFSEGIYILKTGNKTQKFVKK